MDPTRRRLLVTGGAAGLLPRFAIAQADQRPAITIAVQKISNSNTLDDLREQSNVGSRLACFFVERLIDLNYQGALEQRPGLATAWRRIDDRTVEATLRPGVRFHNGDVMTAEDVAFSFGPQRMMGETRPTVQGKTLPLSGSLVTTARVKELPKEVPPVSRRLWPALDRVEVVDAQTVRFVNATPDLTLEGRMSCRGSGITSRRAFDEAASWLDYARAPCGTGPYKVAEYKPDQSLLLVAHDAYWGGRPPLRSVRLVEVPEVSARIAGLLAGEYQFVCDVPPDQIPGIERSGQFEVQGARVPNHRLTTFDKNHPQLHDPRVRLAMAHAIDRQSIVDALWAGRTAVPRGLQWDFYGDMLVRDWTVPQYDVARARELVKAAGYKGDPIPYRLLNNYDINQVPTAQVLVEMWQQAGLNVQIEMKENWSQIFERNGGRGIRDWSNSAPFNDPVSSLVSQHGPNGEQQQYGEYSNEELNRLCVELETGTDPAKRHAVFARLLQIAEREDPAYTVLHQNAVFTAKPKSILWKVAPSFAMDFRAANWGQAPV
ncbi:MAG: ABC transporter substrate-binding protein [Acetobacteraceae bacterium]